MQFLHPAPTPLEALLTTDTPFTPATAACNARDIKVLPIPHAVAINFISVA